MYNKYTLYNLYIYNTNFLKTLKFKNSELNFFNFNFKKISISVRVLIFLVILTNMFTQFNFFKYDLIKFKYLYFNIFFINLV
jgi:hypothetical protein